MREAQVHAMSRLMTKALRLFLPLALLGACATQPAAEARPETVAARPSGAVSSADPRASEAGREILRAGGSASDAAIAMMAALTVVEPQSSGIGGGGFFVVHDAADNRMETYDGRETAPAAATPHYFFLDGKPLSHAEAVPGGKSVGVPGNLRMMATVHERHGKLPWARLFDPAIRLAREGFAITPRLYRALAANRDDILSPWARGQFFNPDGEPKPVGTILKNPELAAFLETLAARGPDSFYVGPAAQDLVQTVANASRNPSQMTLGDLASYDAKERPPVCGTYRGYKICGMGPPSSGGTTVYAILKQLEGFDLAGLGKDNPVAWHLIAESMRLAYADREVYLADPDYVRVPVGGLIAPDYLAERARQIAPDRAIAHVTAGKPAGAQPMPAVADGEVPSTSHMVAVDSAGNVANVTSTIEGAFGSGLTSNGYFLNNELTDFTIIPEKDGLVVGNRVEGGKRPRSSMSPTIVYGPDGKVRIAIGAAGGVTIIAQVAKALIGVLDWNLSAQEAIALPQIIGLGDRVTVERGSALEAMIPALAALGTKAVPANPSFKANAIERTPAGWRGAADPRSEGVALAEQE
ncbi:gamma-glutamyltransferase [Allosphingosinicella humi]